MTVFQPDPHQNHFENDSHPSITRPLPSTTLPPKPTKCRKIFHYPLTITKWIWQKLDSLSLTTWIFVFMVIGIILGCALPESAPYLKPIRNVFLRMIKTLVVPLVFSTLVVGIAGHGDDIKAVGRLALKSLIYFEIVTTVALFIGLAVVNVVKPGLGVKYAGVESNQTMGDFGEQAKETSKITGETILYHIVPTSFFKAAADNEILQVLFCAIMFSIGLMFVKDKKLKSVMMEFCESLSVVMFQVTNVIMKVFCAPAVAASLAVSIAEQGPEVLLNVGKLVLSLFAALAIFVFICLIPIALAARIPLIKFTKCISEPVMIAFTTASSEAGLPLAMENLEAFGIPRKIVAFVLPTGYSFNLDGTTLYLAMAGVFAAQTRGIEMPFNEQLVMMLTLMLTSKGVAAVPRASLLILGGALSQFNLPMEAIGLILGVDAVMDMARTSVNLLGNCLACAVIARWEGELGPGGVPGKTEYYAEHFDNRTVVIADHNGIIDHYHDHDHDHDEDGNNGALGSNNGGGHQHYPSLGDVELGNHASSSNTTGMGKPANDADLPPRRPSNTIINETTTIPPTSSTSEIPLQSPRPIQPTPQQPLQHPQPGSPFQPTPLHISSSLSSLSPLSPITPPIRQPTPLSERRKRAELFSERVLRISRDHESIYSHSDIDPSVTHDSGSEDEELDQIHHSHHHHHHSHSHSHSHSHGNQAGRAGSNQHLQIP